MVAISSEKLKIIFLCLVFFFSVSLRLWNLNKMGQTWDEPAQAIDGYNFIQLIKNKDFTNPYWYNHPDHPPLTKYLYGFAIQFDKANRSEKIENKFYNTNFLYDWSVTRLISVIFSSLSVIIVFLIGWKYFTPFVAILSGIIFSSLPFFIGLSQLATIESILIFFFTASVYSFLLFLKKATKKRMAVTGILIGLAFGTKYTNILLVPLLFWILILWSNYHNKQVKKMKLYKKTITIFLIALLTFFLIWPMPLFHLKEFISYNFDLRVAKTALSVPEVFFGKLILVPKVYYIVYFLITTPIFFLLFFFFGLATIASIISNYSLPHFFTNKHYFLKIIKKKAKEISLVSFLKKFLLIPGKVKYSLQQKKMHFILSVFVIWFLLPFLQSFYNFRQHGVRYIIEIYAPFSLICAIGFDEVRRKLPKSVFVTMALFVIIIFYSFLVLIKISPYYLDYFNSIVGGPGGVYQKKLFQMGWWGQGLGEAGYYLISNTPKGISIGLAVKPLSSVPNIPDRRVEEFRTGKKYDYVLVSYHMIVREGFDDSEIKRNYHVIHEVLVDGAPIVTVYKHK